ncbi:TonB-dependent receptor domain-containing protein [Pontibacter rugosus]|uniref:TonB-dependent receptor domain-containing protein n=1 Tax=Pontibacter rugosus TaxID=1745966 RepID=A0ABW3SRA0_9BACT
MKKNLLLILLGLSTSAVLAQAPQQARPQQQTAIPGTSAPKGNAKISGTILDADTKQPIEFATVALINLSTGKPIDGTMADDKGRFTLQKVAAGKYKLNVSFLGYLLQAVENVTVASDNAEVNVGTVSLGADTKKLSEVVITGEKPLVEEKIDRTVYNAEKDITNAGGSAADVLQKVPSLSVDTDGNVQLRGSANVRVLINNKPSSIMAGSVSDALKQIPADMIKSVEVITSPSAKYDAEGTAGIINIITKKDSGLQGVNGSVALTGGTRSSNGNASLNVRKGKLGINANASTVQFYNHGDMRNVTRFYDETQLLRSQFGDTDIRGGFYNGMLGFDYELSPKNNISGSIRRNGGEFKMENDQSQLVTRDGQPSSEESFNTDIVNRNKRLGTDLNLDFVHTFDKPGQELAILGQYTMTDADTRNYQDRFNQGETPFQLQRNNNDGANNEFTAQVDYVHPLENKTNVEVGAKTILRDVKSDGVSRDIFRDITKSEILNFDYGQDVYAAYATYGFIFKKVNVKLGARFEQTEIDADYYKEDTEGKPSSSPFTDSYNNLIPSVAFSYTVKEKHTFKANFTQRIQRPSLFYLNPFDQNQAPGTVVRGYPELDAELTDLFELGYSTYFKTSFVSANLYMRQTDNAIETVNGDNSGLPDGTTVLTFGNVAKNKTYGMSFYGSIKPVNKLTIGGSSNVYFVDLKSDTVSNSGWMYNINANSSYDFGKGFSAQFNGGFNSRRINLLGSFASFSYHSLAFKKELFAGKGGVSVGLDNPFRKSMKMKNDVAVYNKEGNLEYEQNILINNYNRGARVTFDYRFGKMDKQKAPRRKRSIRNDDTKQGDGNGAGGVQ